MHQTDSSCKVFKSMYKWDPENTENAHVIDHSYIDVSPETLETLIQAMHFHEIEITDENAVGLYILSNFFGMDDIKAKIKENIYTNRSNQCVLNLLLLKNKHGLDTKEDEQFISDKIEQFIDLEQFVDLPIEIIDRIIKEDTKAKSEQIFSLIKRLKDRNHSFGKLQKLVDYRELSDESSKVLDEIVIDYLDSIGVLPKSFMSVEQVKNRHDCEIIKKNEEINDYVETIKKIFSNLLVVPHEIKKTLDEKIIEACSRGRIEYIKKILVACSDKIDKLVSFIIILYVDA